MFSNNFTFSGVFTVTLPSGEHYSWGGGFSVEIPYGAKDVAGSWEFAKFITSKESQVYWASQVYDTVANIEASQDPSLMEIPVFEAALEAMPATVVNPALPAASCFQGPRFCTRKELWRCHDA